MRGYHEPPPAPHTRDADARASRPGAPLWVLCDFLPSVRESDRANIEAALESSGLLDARVTPDGRVLATDEHETLLVAEICEPAPKGKALDAVLTPSIDQQDQRANAVSEKTVRAVLRQIGFGKGTGSAWVDSAGHWQVGPLYGTWTKPAAQHTQRSGVEFPIRNRGWMILASRNSFRLFRRPARRVDAAR